MSNDPENFSQHFRDSWDQTVGAWVSIFKGVRGASKVAARGTKETISSVYEDSKAEAIINISKDIVKTTAHGSTAAVGIIVEKGKEAAGISGKGSANAKADERNRAGGPLSSTQQKLLVGLVVGIVVAQTGYIVYLYNCTKKVDKPAPKWQMPDKLRSQSPVPSPSPMVDVLMMEEAPVGEEEEDRRLAASEARYRKDMDMESMDSEIF